jgi:hypothetical protein
MAEDRGENRANAGMSRRDADPMRARTHWNRQPELNTFSKSASARVNQKGKTAVEGGPLGSHFMIGLKK